MAKAHHNDSAPPDLDNLDPSSAGHARNHALSVLGRAVLPPRNG
jgi:hypothetical protein